MASITIECPVCRNHLDLEYGINLGPEITKDNQAIPRSPHT